ncbi:MAG TPA: molybdopterin molybdotransferase MoeA, partial [Thermoanaerobaculia bacterium]|nr:molybdopterin molybdotransferase MoeA [Thermoanaerobaculia bacterium]
ISFDPLPEGGAIKVMTGAPMPEGSDAVVPVEKADADGDRVRLLEAPVAGAHVRRRGEVIASGTALLAAGRKLSPADLVLLAAAGRSRARVARRARAAVLVTGDEIVPADALPGPGQIRNTNGPLLLGALVRLGAEIRDLGVARDERDSLKETLAKALAAEPDLLLTTGGVSAGDFDLVGEVLRDLGVEVLFHKVAMRPAKPVLVATRGKTLVFGLPGNPVSAAAAFDLFVRAAWRKASGLSPALPDPVAVRLRSRLANKGDRRAFLPGRLTFEGGKLRAEPIATKGSHDVLAHARANAYLVVPPRSSFDEGDDITAYPGTEETTIATPQGNTQ